MRSFQRKNSEKGSSLLEGALVTGVFFMMIFGIIDFGRAVYEFNSLEFAANAGARYACVRGAASTAPASSSEITTYVNSQVIGVAPSVTVNTVSTTTSTSASWPTGNTAGNFVDVVVQHSFQPIVPYVPTGLWLLKGESRMLISQ